MVKSTQIARLDGMHQSVVQIPPDLRKCLELILCLGIPLAATVDDDQAEAELAEVKQQCKQVFKRLNQNSEPRASIESGPFTLQ
jgi:hypothetical protein